MHEININSRPPISIQKNHNTIEYIHRMVNNIIYCIGKSNYCTVVSLYAKNAYNKVQYERVLKKLQSTLTRNICTVFSSCFTNRYFYVNINNITFMFIMYLCYKKVCLDLYYQYFLFTVNIPISNWNRYDEIYLHFAGDRTMICTPKKKLKQ